MNRLMISVVVLAFLSLRHGSLSCRFHEQDFSDVKQILVQAFKNKLLKELGFSSVPNVSKNLAPKIPSFYKHLIEAENIKPIQTTESDKDDFHAKTKQLFLFPKQVTNGIGKNYIFKVNPRHSILEIKSATLWIHITERSKSVEKPDHGKRAELQLYKSYQASENGLRAKELFYSKQLNAAGWYNVTVSGVVKEWFSMQENLQLSLDIAVKGTNSLEIDGGDVSGNGGPLHPFLAVDTEEKQQVNRQKRQVVDECPVTRPETCCRLHPFEVDVSDISWDFIIAPKTLNISACAGSCGSPRHAFYRSRNLTRAIAFNEMNMLKPQCCVPKRMGSLSLIYFDHNQAIQKTEFPNLKVLSCHCTF